MLDDNKILDENKMLDIKDIKLNDKSYNIKLYLKHQDIIFELESFNNHASRKYEKSFSQESLRKIDKHFKMSENINGVFTDFKELFDEKFIIEEGNSFADFTFILKKREIKIHLIEIKENQYEIDYNSLSNQMKSIIDNNELILGIDLGTTYSCASVMLDKNILVIQNSLGLRTTPSFVIFLEKKKFVLVN